MSRSRPAVTLAIAAIVAVLISPLAPAVAAADESRSVSYIPPIDAPVVDGWRPPASEFAAGNRGIDYAAAEGEDVRASADGQVAFAGRIGSTVHVVVLHADGVRTSYSFLQSAAVQRGDRVRQGDVIGSAAGELHFGARIGPEYVDPTDLFAGQGPAVRLVPVEKLPPVEDERNLLMRMLAATGAGVAVGAGWVVDRGSEIVDVASGMFQQRFRQALHYFRALFPPLVAADLAREWAEALGEWEATRDTCTPPDVDPPPPAGRRIAVLVGGLGSASASIRRGGGIGRVDTAGLGFAPSDVYAFSYQGGHVGERGYGREDTQNGFDESGAKLAAFLSRLRRENSGVPITLIAHSQGGLVSRSAIARGGPGAAAVTDLITLATPHHGSDAATAFEATRGSLAGQALVDTGGRAFAGIDPGSKAVQQLSETSDYIRNQPPVPGRIRFTSIAGTGDPIVAAPRARVEGADNRLVSAGTLIGDHDALPGHAKAHREMALALAGMEATCKSREAFIWDRLRAYANGVGVDLAGFAASTLLGRFSPRVPT